MGGDNQLQFIYNLFIPLLVLILLLINWIFSPNNPYLEKNSVFECGFHSFLWQNRIQFTVSFFIFALLFLLFDLEILLAYPYLVSSYINEIYGLIILAIFFLFLTLGFHFELGKKSLIIYSKQIFNMLKVNSYYINNKNTYLYKYKLLDNSLYKFFVRNTTK
jgi:NADH-ubiquinone oxidoreductase chain 3